MLVIIFITFCFFAVPIFTAIAVQISRGTTVRPEPTDRKACQLKDWITGLNRKLELDSHKIEQPSRGEKILR